MERSDLPDKLFAEDTLPHPGSVDGERPRPEERTSVASRGNPPGSPDEDMLAVEYREDEIRASEEPHDSRPRPGESYAQGDRTH